MAWRARLWRWLAIAAAAALPAIALHAQTPGPAPTLLPAPATSPPSPSAPTPARHGLRTGVRSEIEPAAPSAPQRPGARLAPGQPIPPAELEAFVDGVVSQAMARDHIVGVTVSVVQAGQVVLKKGYGAASLAPYRPVEPDATLFRIGSISKTFTWILVLRQVEAGHMRLDAPVNLYLPETLQVRDDGYSQPVRLSNLMNHTPGFEDRALGQLFERDYDRVRSLATYLRQERPRRVRPPGSLVSYSNYGAALAGEAVSEVSGKTYEALAEAEILAPLGLSHTSFREPHPTREGMPAPMAAALAANLAKPYRWTGSGYAAQPFEFVGQVAPAGAGSSTAGDMARYMAALLNGGTLDGVAIYGPATAEALATPLPRPAPGVPAYRHGLSEVPLSGGFTGVGHAGATLSFMSNMVLVKDLGLGVFVSTNTDTGNALSSSLPDRIVAHFYASPSGAPAPGSAALVEQRAAFEGVYLSDRRAYHGLEGFLTRLIFANRVGVTADGHLVVQGFDGTSRWSPEGDPHAGQFVSPDGDPSRLVFQLEDGRTQRFFAPWGGITYERVGLLGQSGALFWLTVLVAATSTATLVGLFMRLRRDFRETMSQQRASLLQTSQSLLWLMALLLFAMWGAGANDIAAVMYGWPGPAIILASTCAFVASAMALGGVAFLPFVWRGGRRVDSWTIGRKARFTLTAVIFLAYAVLLFFWGALEPWSG